MTTAQCISIRPFSLESRIITTAINSTRTAQLHFQPTSSTFTQRSSFVPTNQPSKCSSPSPPSLLLSPPSPWLLPPPLPALPRWSSVTLRPSAPCRLRLRPSSLLRRLLVAPSSVSLQHSIKYSKILTKLSECIAALAPTAAACAAALAEAGLNPLADAACLATLANSVFNVVSILSNVTSSNSTDFASARALQGLLDSFRNSRRA